MEERTLLLLAASDARLSVRSFVIDDALDRPFEVSLVTVSERDDVDLDQIVGRGASFRIDTGRASCPSRAYTGFCAQAELASVESTGLSTYLLTIVPSFSRTRLRVGARIFQHLSAVEIVRDLLAEWDIQVELALDPAAYPPLEYRVQYAESDFSFVSRTLEEAGIVYRFLQPDGAAPDATTRMCLLDEPQTGAVRTPAVRFFADGSTPSAQTDSITSLQIGRRARPGRFAFRDHDYRLHADLELGAEARAASPTEERYEHFVYSPGAMLIEPDGGPARSVGAYGEALAQRRLSAVRQGARSVSFTTNTFDLEPGMSFEIAGHPHPLVALGRRLLVTRQTIRGDVSEEWTVTGDAVFGDEPYRPALVTPRPLIAGLMSALVVGPPGEEIHTDSLGRVRVVFHWDRRARQGAARAGESSCWIRVSQGWAGKGRGLFTLPRVGDEVLVDFLGGDPDQPVVVGSLHSASAPTFHRLPDHKTRTVWRSDSSPGSGGANEISFEDQKGQEQLTLQAERDLEVVVKNEERRTVEADRRTRVAGDDVCTVGGDEAIRVEGDRATEVAGFERAKSHGGYSVASGRAGLTMRPDGSIALSNGQASIVLSGPNVFIDAAAHIRATAGEVAALFGGEVHIDGRPNVFINAAHAADPAPVGASDSPVGAFLDPSGQPMPALPGGALDGSGLEDPGGYDEIGLDPEEARFQAELDALPDRIALPPSVNEQLRRHALLAVIPGPPYLLLDQLRTKAELFRDRVKERAAMARDRAEEALVDLRARVESAKQQVLSRIDAVRARAESIRDRAVAELESVRARALAARDRVVAGVAEVRDRVTRTAEAIHARIDAAKAQIVGRIEAIKAQIAAQREAIQARFDALKEQVRAIPRAMVESWTRQIESLKMEGLAIAQSLQDSVHQIGEEAKATIEGIKEELGLAKDELASAVEDIQGSAKEAVESAKGAVEDIKSSAGESFGADSGIAPSPEEPIGQSATRTPATRGRSGPDAANKPAAGTGRAGGTGIDEAAGRRRGNGSDFWEDAQAAGGEAQRNGDQGRGSPFADHTAMTRSGGFGGSEVGRTVNGTRGATFLQSPNEGQLMVVRTAGARDVDAQRLGTEVVDAQMEGQPVTQSLARRLGQDGYAVYERPWGNFAGEFVKVALA